MNAVLQDDIVEWAIVEWQKQEKQSICSMMPFFVKQW